jgi:hypothetical protein
VPFESKSGRRVIVPFSIGPAAFEIRIASHPALSRGRLVFPLLSPIDYTSPPILIGGPTPL